MDVGDFVYFGQYVVFDLVIFDEQCVMGDVFGFFVLVDVVVVVVEVLGFGFFQCLFQVVFKFGC